MSGDVVKYNALTSTLGGHMRNSLSASSGCGGVPPPCCREPSPPMIDSGMREHTITDKNTQPENGTPVVREPALHVLGIHRTEAVLETLRNIHLSLIVIVSIEFHF